MTADYFDPEKTGGSKDSIEITLDVKTEKVMDFVNEIRNATLDEILEIIHRYRRNTPLFTNQVDAMIRDFEALKGKQDEKVHKNNREIYL